MRIQVVAPCLIRHDGDNGQIHILYRLHVALFLIGIVPAVVYTVIDTAHWNLVSIIAVEHPFIVIGVYRTILAHATCNGH